jgi:L-malate glycosyltransferase
MKSIHVDTQPGWRGGQNQILLTLRGLRARGHQAELLALADGPMAIRAAAEGFTVYPVPRTGVRVSAARILRKLLELKTLDVVHAHDPHGLTAAWLARAHRNAILVAHRRVVAPLSNGKIALARYRAAHRIFAISQVVAKHVIASGINPARVEVNYDGVEIPAAITEEARAQARQKWGIAPEQIVLGYSAYMTAGKDHEALLRAMPAVLSRFPHCQLLLAGDGARKPELEKLTKELGIGKSVLFAGFVEKIDQFFQALDLFLFPALGEGLGSSLLAAMAYGIPSIAAASGGVPEVIEPDASGLLVPPSNSGLFSEAILRLLSDREEAGRIGAAGRKHVEEKFSADRMVEGILEKYERLLHAKNQ